MSKRVLILSGSPRKHGNTDRMADEFARGAIEAGHEVEKIFVCDRDIRPCRGCTTCVRNGSTCAMKDDMAYVGSRMLSADAIALASPVYYYTWNAQMKAVLDRSVAVSSKMRDKTFYLLSAGQAPDESYMKPMIEDFRRYIGCFKGSLEGGYAFAYGVDRPGDVEGTPELGQAYDMGRSL